MQRLHIQQQSKGRRDIPPPQHHRAAMRQKGDGYDQHHLCHVHPFTPYSRDNYDLHVKDYESDTVEPQPGHPRQAPTSKQTVHCYFCPHFRGQDPTLKMDNVESNVPVHHHKIHRHTQHESQCIHHQSRLRSPDSRKYEEPDYHTQGIQTNERKNHAATVKHFRQKGLNDLLDRGHHHDAPQARSTYDGATVCKSHKDECGSNIKAVRFEEDNMMPEYTATRNSNCPIHHIPSSVGYQSHSRLNPRHRQSHSREPRSYRWVWGPPLPAVVPQHGNIYYAENY